MQAMCLITLQFAPDSETPLIVAANRDEFFARPSAALHAWEDAPIIGGRDLEAGGSWLAIDQRGRFAAVTNWRDPLQPAASHSRGELISDFLTGSANSRAFAQQRLQRGGDYAGFNLLLYDGETLCYASNTAARLDILDAGHYALSNTELDSDWPKVSAAREALLKLSKEEALEQEALLELLADRRTYPSEQLPNTGLPLALEQQLSAAFIVREDYGTRAMTALQLRKDASAVITERSYTAKGVSGEVTLQLPARG